MVATMKATATEYNYTSGMVAEPAVVQKLFLNISEAPIDSQSAKEDHNFTFDEVLNGIKEENFLQAASPCENNLSATENSMNLIEMSKCIVTIENNNTFTYDYETDALPIGDSPAPHKMLHFPINDFNDVIDFDQNDDEYVSIESIKKYLGEHNMDYIDSALQNHLNLDFLNDLN